MHISVYDKQILCTITPESPYELAVVYGAPFTLADNIDCNTCPFCKQLRVGPTSLLWVAFSVAQRGWSGE